MEWCTIWIERMITMLQIDSILPNAIILQSIQLNYFAIFLFMVRIDSLFFFFLGLYGSSGSGNKVFGPFHGSFWLKKKKKIKCAIDRLVGISLFLDETRPSFYLSEQMFRFRWIVRHFIWNHFSKIILFKFFLFCPFRFGICQPNIGAASVEQPSIQCHWTKNVRRYYKIYPSNPQ